MKEKITRVYFLNNTFYTVLLLFVVSVLQSATLAANKDCTECITYTYHFQNDKVQTLATVPPAFFTQIGNGNAGSAGVISYTGTDGVSNVFKPFGVGQRNSTAVVNLKAFPKKASDYSVTWKQYYDTPTEGYKTGVVLRADTSKVGNATTGYVQGIMNGYVLLPYSNASNGCEFRIYKSTSNTSLSMLTNVPVPSLISEAKKPVWYRASVSGTTQVQLTLEYSTDSLIWNIGATVIDSDTPFQVGATQLIWGLAVSRTDFCFDNITFNGIAEDGIDTSDNTEEPTTDIVITGLGGQGKHYKMTIPVSTNGVSATREMIVYVPQNISENCPMLISCHGSGQGDAYQAEKAAYWMVADTAKFITVYPNGTNLQWNSTGDEDLNFMSAIIDYMYQRFKVDKKRVYLSGFSMGSMFTYYAANKMSDKIAAFAPTMGYNFSATATSTRPVPILQVIGTTDEVFTDRTGHMAILNAWISRNRCSTQSVITQPYPVGSTTSQAVKTLWINPQTGIEVVLITTPKGHWHSNDPLHIMTNLEVWNFCKRYSLDGLIISAVSNVKQESGTVIKEEYYTLMGRKTIKSKTKRGELYVLKKTMSDGTVNINKVLVQNND